MGADRWARVQELFEAALACSPDERGALLAAECAGDDALRDEVLSLLAGDADAPSLLDGRALGAFGLPDELRASTARPGDRIGPYRVVREIGRGGMGAVYLAERDDGQFEQRAALKLIRRGMGSDEILRRFLAERQILARLQHPHVARLLDGGVTADGTPWFALEYVKGEPIDRYCDRHALPIEERLRLFLDVCDAVQYAHRSLVVHRDLKPDNVLVDRDGRVKLLDFGIAKLLGGDEAEIASVTRTGASPRTPLYAAPEQVRGEPVTTATDVYALGLVLYRLLTGQSAHRLEGASPAEVEQAICTTEPPRPSVAVTRAAQRGRVGQGGDGMPATVASVRRLAPERLRRRLRGDLDTIVMRALQKEPGRRFASVEQLAEDLRRHLAGQPVLSRPAGAAYRVRKFVTRNRVPVAAAVALLLSLSGGLAAALWQGAEAARQRDVAERERSAAVAASKQVTAVRDFLTDLFQASDPTVTAGAELSVRDLLDRGTTRVDALADQPPLQADLLDVLASVQMNVGNYRTANELRDRELRIRRTMPPDSLLVKTINFRGQTFDRLGEPDSAAAYFRQALELGSGMLGPTHALMRDVMSNLAVSYERLGRVQDADSLYRLVIAADSAALGRNDLGRSLALNNYGLQLANRKRYADAEPLLRESLRIREANGTEPSVSLGFALDNLGMMLREAGRYDEAEPYIRRGLAVRRKVLGDDHRFTGESYFSLGVLLAHRGRGDDHVQADSLLRAALDNFRRNLGPEHPAVAYPLHALGELQARRGDDVGAERWLRQALAIRRASGRDSPRVTVQTLVALGRVQRRRGAPAAEALLREADSLARARLPADDPARAEAAAALGEHVAAPLVRSVGVRAGGSGGG